MPDLGIFGLKFEIFFVIFEISVLKFVLLQSLVQKKKSLNMGLKMLDLSSFRLKLENNIIKLN